MSTSGNTIVTHSGTHHADEALAVFMLRKLPQYQSMSLVRTRDQALIDQGSIVVDVGAEYDPARHRYDHHQRGFEETFDAQHSIKLSSAGLVWKHFGTQILAEHLQLPKDDARVSLLHLKLYDDFVQAIDAIDNGISQYPASAGQPLYKSKTDLSSRVGHTNPRWNQASDEADQNARFERASTMAGTEFFERVDYTFEAWLPAREIVLNALNARKDVPGGDAQGRILVFDEFASWKDHIFQLEADLAIPQAERALYVVYPDEAGKWRVQAVPVNADSFVSRKPLPEPWRGIRDQALSDKTGIAGCIFVHQSGFIGGNATKEGALEMARKAVANVIPPSPITSPVFPLGARPIILLGPSSVVAPPANPDSSATFSSDEAAAAATHNPLGDGGAGAGAGADTKSKALRSLSLPDDLALADESAVRHRFVSLPHPSTGAPTYFALYKRAQPARGASSSGASPSRTIPGLAELNLDPAAQLDGLLELHVLRPESVERSWFVGSTGAEAGAGAGAGLHAPVPGSDEAREAQRRALVEEQAQARARAEEERKGVQVKVEQGAATAGAGAEPGAGADSSMEIDDAEGEGEKETQMGAGPASKSAAAAAVAVAARRKKPQFAGQVVSDGAVHMLVPVDPVFVLIPLLSLIAPTNPADLGRFQPADDLFDDLAMAAFRRLAHKHNERVLAQREKERAAAAAAAASKKGGNKKGKGRQMMDADVGEEAGVELLEEEGVWTDVVKLGAARAGLDALQRVCDTQALGTGMTVYRFSPSKALALLEAKVRKVANVPSPTPTAAAFGHAPSTLGRAYARALAKLGDDDAEGGGEGGAMDVDGVGRGMGREERVRVQVALGAVSPWLDAGWRAKLETALLRGSSAGAGGDGDGDGAAAEAS
ncbi:hypothetical protein OC834_005997 [Tilletia horrida]|nr:hypothetical protein OC834_005997 [Tilletia horrida]